MTSPDAVANEKKYAEWQPLIELSTREVFELMMGASLSSAPDFESAEFEITSMVGLAGQVCGMLSIRCSKKAAVLIASKLLGCTATEVNPEVQDAFGEVANMVAGNFKNKVAGMGDGCMLSVPTVIVGSDYDVHSLADTAGVEGRFLFEDMPIAVKLEIQS